MPKSDRTEPFTTETFHDWLRAAPDNVKKHFAINWCRIPHTLFNVACKYHDASVLQGVDWFKIHQSRDAGRWSHGGEVICL